MAKTTKKPSKKVVEKGDLWADDGWRVVHGRLKPEPGRPAKQDRLFLYVAEKLPYASLSNVKKWMEKKSEHLEGVYLSHDSMGAARYGGRGQIFSRLAAHKRMYPRELSYFSFFVVKNKQHEREIETIILRSAGPQLVLNQKKVRTGINPGNVNDYEPGTLFIERQMKKGKKRKKGKK